MRYSGKKNASAALSILKNSSTPGIRSRLTIRYPACSGGHVRRMAGCHRQKIFIATRGTFKAGKKDLPAAAKLQGVCIIHVFL